MHTKSLSISQPLPSVDENPINENEVSEINSQGLQGPEKANENPNQKELESNPHHPFDDDPSADLLWQKSSLSAKNQKTLLEYAKPDTTVLEKDASLKQVIDAVAELSLKVENIGKQHTTFLQLAFEDKDVRRSVSAMRKAENILELTESTQLLEWFYDESTECAVLRCLPCFELNVAAKPTLAKLTPLSKSSANFKPQKQRNSFFRYFCKEGKHQTFNQRTQPNVVSPKVSLHRSHVSDRRWINDSQESNGGIQ